jgi:hypothetical protein
MGHIHVCFLCCLVVTIRGPVTSWSFNGPYLTEKKKQTSQEEITNVIGPLKAGDRNN